MQKEPNRLDLQQVLVLVRWLLIISFVVLGWIVLAYMAHVLAPILAALGIAYLLNPVADALTRRGMSRPRAATRRAPSSIENTPATHAAAYSPML